MTNSTLKRLTGLAAAACTTLVLFSTVAGLAEHDRTALELVKAGRPAVLASAAATAR